MPKFGDLFTYDTFDMHFTAVSYYGVILSNDWKGFDSGTEIHRLDLCVETGTLFFIDSNESTMYKGNM